MNAKKNIFLVIGWALIAGFPICILSGWILECSLPKFYWSYAALYTESERKEAKEISDHGSDSWPSAEPVIIQSKTILYPVIEKLDLQRKIAQHTNAGALTQAQTYDILREKYLLVHQARLSAKVIDVQARFYTPGEAELIVNAIVEQYQEYRAGKGRRVIIVSETETSSVPDHLWLIMLASGAAGIVSLSAGLWLYRTR